MPALINPCFTIIRNDRLLKSSPPKAMINHSNLIIEFILDRISEYLILLEAAKSAGTVEELYLHS